MALQFLRLTDEYSITKTVDLLKKYPKQPDVYAQVFAKYQDAVQTALDAREYLKVVTQTLDVIHETITDVKRISSLLKSVLTPIYSSVAYWVTLITNNTQSIQAVEAYYAHIRALGAENNNFKLKLAALLFNSLPTIELFKRMIALSVELNNTSLIIQPILQDIAGFLQQWSLTPQAQLQFLMELVNTLETIKNIDSVPICAYIITRLPHDKEAETQRVFVTFLNSNVLVINKYQPSLLLIGQAVISQAFKLLLQNKSLLAQYVQLIVDGNITEFHNLVNSSDLQQRYQLNWKLGLKSVKLSKLAQIADTQTRFTYNELAQQLEIQESEVEQWIISAIQAQIVEAKIDQQSNQVTILDNTSRTFTNKHWAILQAKLGQLSAKIGTTRKQ